MNVRNVHRRMLAAPLDAACALLDDLASPRDRLWPRGWPPMRLTPGLAVGARGGHGPIRYTVELYEPGRLAQFRFTAPRGFDGLHRFEVAPAEEGEGTLLSHVLEMRLHGPARLTWPLLFRPLHDALVEDALDRAQAVLADPPPPRRWPLRVRALRRLVGAVGGGRASGPRGPRDTRPGSATPTFGDSA